MAAMLGRRCREEGKIKVFYCLKIVSRYLSLPSHSCAARLPLKNSSTPYNGWVLCVSWVNIVYLVTASVLKAFHRCTQNSISIVVNIIVSSK